MAVESEITVLEGISFEQAIALTQQLLDAMEQQSIASSKLAEVLKDLVKTENGARGFFVNYLSDDRPLADQPEPAVLQALQVAPAAVIAPLLVKNLSMSTAMAVFHRRNQNAGLAQSSDRVRSRSMTLIQALKIPQLRAEAQELASSIANRSGRYAAFLERWGYDDEQKAAMRSALETADLV